MRDTNNPRRERSLLPWAVLGDDGFRIFFPLAAVHAALWPVLWGIVLGFQLPFENNLPPSLIHAHEMIIGSYGAALIGFITTAVPEWTDTNRLRYRPLFLFAALWGTGRIIGILGAEPLWFLAAICDVAWSAGLVAYLTYVSWQKRTTGLFGFIFWCSALALSEAASRISVLQGDLESAHTLIHVSGFIFLGLLGLALTRITVPVTNRILDPSEETSPFRPHPGRRNLAPALIVVFVAGELAGLSDAARAFLAIAAGAAFLDRVAEAFIGRQGLRGEILSLAGSSALAGVGLCLLGAARLGAPFTEVTALHVAFMGGLGLGVLAVLSIAGLSHTGQPLRFTPMTNLAVALLVAAVALRVLPDLDVMPAPPGPPYAVASLIWSSAFMIWLYGYWPAIVDPNTMSTERC